MSATTLRPFHLDAPAVGITALITDSNAPEHRGCHLALAAAPHDRHMVSVRRADTDSWIPLLTRGAALASLPGREADADTVLAALDRLAAHVCSPGRAVDVGARGVFVDGRVPGTRVRRRRGFAAAAAA
ncbi:hypothetical protein [Actinorugispora endophytica]|uniref:Uncharacterized protein n=1 Tax=Actinorugispora endophytica TaxID=1605990 RepID=A0A4R6UFB6_9ACTN|nr:hypothetical protein [Actinorugispora endophytica]TDQ43899.1 hypothetical protein EV190_13911 [Actinorugispora endophytica]